jgi:hypothetical protein
LLELLFKLMDQTSSRGQPAGTPVSRTSRRNLTFAILSLCVALLIPLSAITGSQSVFGTVSDFPEYYAAMKMVAQGRGDLIYRLPELFREQHQFFPQMQGRGIGFYIPPFAAPLLYPLSLLPPFPSYCLFMSAALSALLGGAVALGKHFKLSPTGVIFMLAVIFAGGPAFESLKIAQLSPFLFAALSFFIYFAGRRNEIASGLSLAVLLFKPQELLPVAVYLAFGGRGKAVLTLVGAFLVLAVISLLLFGQGGYLNYLDLLRDSAANTQYMQPELSATLRGQLLRLACLGNGTANALSAIVLACVLAVIAFVAYKHGGKDDFETGFLRLALPLGLASALHCHDYDLLLLVPWIVSLLTSRDKSRLGNLTRLALVLMLLAFSIPLYVPIHYKWLMRDGQAANPLFLLLALSGALSAALFLSGAGRQKDGTRTCRTQDSN